MKTCAGGGFPAAPLADGGPPGAIRPWAAYTNNPLRRRAGRQLVPRLRVYLSERLPDYMSPAAFVVLDALPRLPNGKVDRRALPAPGGTRPELEEPFRAPRTPGEETLARIWAEILRLDRVGVDDNFFELGGDSILSIQIVARANQAGLQFTAKDLFRHQTVAELAAIATSGRTDAAGDRPATGPVPLTPIQRWFFARRLPEPWHFNQCVLLAPRRPLAAADLEAAVAMLVVHHDALRLRFERRGDEWSQVNAGGDAAAPWTQVDLTALASTAAAIAAASARLQASLDLTAGPLLRVVCFTARTVEESRLLVVVHHLAVDTYSWRILLADFERVTLQASAGETPALPPKTTSFKDWAEHLEAHASSEETRRELDYWLAVAPPTAPLPRDHGAPGPERNTTVSEASVSVTLGADSTRRLLRQVPAAYRTQINDVLLTALVRAVARWTGQRSLLLELEGHGREELFAGLDVSRTVGWFTTTCPLLLTLADGEAAALKGIKEQLRAVPRRGIGYGLVRYLGNDPETLAELRSRPEPEISFNYLGQLDSLLSESSLFALAEEEAGPIRSLRGLRPRVLEINCGISGGELRMRWTYSRHLHRRATIERLAGDFLNQLEGLIAHCLAPGAGGTTPSDFPLAGLDQKTLDRITGELAHRDLEDVYPLSPMQEGMLFHTLAAPASEIYCEQLDWALRGPLDLRAFRSAWERVVERYGVLRSSFVWEDLKRPLQIVHRRVALPFSEHDWRDLGPGEQQDRLAATLAAERERGFQLAQAPLMRLTVVRLGDESYRVVWTSHHLLLDGWSMPLLLEEVFAFYQGYCSGREIERPLPRPYRDYIAWLAGRDPAPAAEYWRRRLAGFTQPTPLPLAAGEIEAGDGRQEERELRLPAASTARLCALARGRQLTLNTLVQGAWALVLARTTGEDDVAFGTVDSGRPESLPGADGIIGLMINTLPVRVRIRPDEPLRPWLERLQEEIAESRRFGTTPLVEIRSFSEVPSELPLFDTILAFQNYPIRPELRRRHPQIDDLRGFSRTNYPLTLVAAPGDELLLRLTYETARVSATGAGRLLRHLRVLLTGMVGASTLASLTLLSAAERHQLLVEWNDIPSRQPADGRSLPELFAAQARRAPDAVAVILVHSDRTLTYAELNRRANQLAHHLRRLGVGPEVRVGLCLERSPEMIVALLGILKAGGAYVPLEPSYPAERLAQILDDAGVAVLVTTSEVLARLPVHRAAAVCLDLEAAIADGPESSPEVTVRSQNTAYVIYTSGSTGRPKGVAVTHGNVVRLFAATRDWFRFGPGDVWTLFHSIAFDFSVWEVWGALVHGGRLVVVPYLVSRSPEAFCELLADAGVSVLNQTPSAFRMLIEAEARVRPKLRLRWVIFGGEALELTSLIPWFARHGDRRPRLVNMYGITETTVHVTYRPISETEARRVRGSLIGRQIPDLRLYVLDPRRRPVPVAVPGELCVGGAGLARGYLGRPGLTAERFVPSPFDEVPGARLYRTGDRVRVRATGELEYLGRIDHQLKIRGFRIEPGEIEAVLSEHPAVRHCLVMAREDEPGKKRLVAYWIGDEEAGAAELRERLHAKLPEYMVPATFVRLVAFPLTPHGKVDRRALPPPEGAEPKEGGIGPRNTAEELLAAIWCAVLGIERVGMDDSFFAAGGDSILAIRLLARMRQSGLDLTLEQLFQYPTIAELARLASRGDGEAVATATHPFSLISAADRRELPPEVEDAYPLTRMQAGMLFHSELSPETSIYHDIFSNHVQAPLDLRTWRRAIAREVAIHPVLRTSFALAGREEPLQLVHRQVPLPLEVVDLRHLAPADQEDAVDCWLEEERQRPFVWNRPPLLRFVIHPRSDETFQFSLSFHHAIFDGWSVASLQTELFQSYLARLENPSENPSGWQGQTTPSVGRTTSRSVKMPQASGVSKFALVCPGTEQGQGALTAGGGGISGHHDGPDESPQALPLPPLGSGGEPGGGAPGAVTEDRPYIGLWKSEVSVDLPRPPTVTFRDYVALERRSLESETSRRYWLDKLARISPILLPRLARRKRPRVGAVGVYQATISDHLSERLKALARELGMPVKSVLLAAHLRVLSVLGNQADVVTGLVANGRPEAADGERTLGLFLNTLPLRVRVPGGSWTSLVEAAYQADLEALPHRRYPLAEIQRELGGQPLFETAFNYTHFHIYRGLAATEGVASLGGKSFERTNFALLVNFSLGILSGQVELSLHYDAGELERAQVVLFGRYYAAALAAMTRAPAERYELRTLLSPAERHQLVVEWNVTGRPAGDPPRRRCLHDLFAEQAERTPAAIAVVSGGRVLSYRELDRRADRLARRLGSLGVGPEAAVGISLERSLELMVAVLAVLKAGGVCVPLDRAYPRPHREFILRDSRAAVLLADERPESVPSGVRVVCPDDARENPSSHAGRPASGVRPANLAYLIYTSGSTGRPKGVAMTHGALSNLIAWQNHHSGLSQGGKTLQFTSLSFDVSFQEIFAAWSSGGTLVLISDTMRRDPAALHRWIAAAGVERIFLPFVALGQLADAAVGQAPSGLREVITAGEQLRVDETVARFCAAAGCSLHNQYGPAETHVVTAHDLTGPPRDWPALPPIGRPIANTCIHLLDVTLRPVPAGVMGELYIGGAGLGRGYQHRPRLTAERFVPDPFAQEPGTRLYKSGDLARYLPDGSIEFLCRVDFQVKIRGYRVEPGEVEAVLESHPAVRKAVVVAREDARRGWDLVAFLVMQDAAEPRPWLAKRLPEYMVPFAFLAVDDLPLLPSGKVDRGALIRRAASAAGTLLRPGDRPYVPPHDATEEALAEIWSQLLGVKRVGVRDDFTALGGHSLLAVRLMAQIEQRFGVKLPLATLLREPTVEQLARVIGGPSTPEEFSPLVPLQPSGSRRPFFCVHPGGGHVLCYFELARRLGDDQPFYGFQALGSDGGDAFDPDIPAMAARYCAAMRTVQPQGPYCLGGWSMGGVVAFEMAQQLRADGEEVALLTLIDSTPPAPLPPAAVADPTAGLAAFARHLGLPDPDLAGEDRPQPPLDEHLRAILAQARQAGFLPSEIDLPRLRHLYRLFRNNLRAMAAYELRPYDGRVVLFRARERPVEAAADPGWGVLARGGLRLYAIPGDHFTMVREPQVAVLARQLGSDLRESDC